MELIVPYILSVPAVLLAIILHELAHGYCAYKLGDPTARNMGRLTLNPFKHLDIIGTLCMILFHFGWAKPVPINSRYFKHQRRDIALTALAGPLTNLLLAFLVLPLFLWVRGEYLDLYFSGQGEHFWALFLKSLATFFEILHSVNLGLCLFNLIPIPPLDGSRILFTFLPPKHYFAVMRYERYFSLALMLVLLGGVRLGFLNTIASAVSRAMLSFWSLFPIF